MAADKITHIKIKKLHIHQALIQRRDFLVNFPLRHSVQPEKQPQRVNYARHHHGFRIGSAPLWIGMAPGLFIQQISLQQIGVQQEFPHERNKIARQIKLFNEAFQQRWEVLLREGGGFDVEKLHDGRHVKIDLVVRSQFGLPKKLVCFGELLRVQFCRENQYLYTNFRDQQYQTIKQSMKQWRNQSNNRSINRSINLSNNRQTNQLINWSNHQSIERSINGTINQPIDRSNRWPKQSINK